MLTREVQSKVDVVTCDRLKYVKWRHIYVSQSINALISTSEIVFCKVCGKLYSFWTWHRCLRLGILRPIFFLNTNLHLNFFSKHLLISTISNSQNVIFLYVSFVPATKLHVYGTSGQSSGTLLSFFTVSIKKLQFLEHK